MGSPAPCVVNGSTLNMDLKGGITTSRVISCLATTGAPFGTPIFWNCGAIPLVGLLRNLGNVVSVLNCIPGRTSSISDKSSGDGFLRFLRGFFFLAI